MKPVQNHLETVSLLKKELWKRGLYYRSIKEKLAGKPDIIFAGAKLVVFCFDDVEHGRYWDDSKDDLTDQTIIAKIEKQMRSDKRNRNKLEKAGWTVINLWDNDIISDVSAASDYIEKLFRSVKPDCSSVEVKAEPSDENLEFVINMFNEVGEYSVLHPQDLELLFGKNEDWQKNKESRVWVNKARSHIFIHPKNKAYFFKLPAESLIFSNDSYWIYHITGVKKLSFPKDVQRYLSAFLEKKETDISKLNKNDIKYGKVHSLNGDVEKWKAIAVDAELPEQHGKKPFKPFAIKPIEKDKIVFLPNLDIQDIGKIFAKKGLYSAMKRSVLEGMFDHKFNGDSDLMDVYLWVDSGKKHLYVYFRDEFLCGKVSLSRFDVQGEDYYYRNGQQKYLLSLSQREKYFLKGCASFINKNVDQESSLLFTINSASQATALANDITPLDDVDGVRHNPLFVQNINQKQQNYKVTIKEQKNKKVIFAVVILCIAIITIIPLAFTVNKNSNSYSATSSQYSSNSNISGNTGKSSSSSSTEKKVETPKVVDVLLTDISQVVGTWDSIYLNSYGGGHWYYEFYSDGTVEMGERKGEEGNYKKLTRKYAIEPGIFTIDNGILTINYPWPYDDKNMVSYSATINEKGDQIHLTWGKRSTTLYKVRNDNTSDAPTTGSEQKTSVKGEYVELTEGTYVCGVDFKEGDYHFDDTYGNGYAYCSEVLNGNFYLWEIDESATMSYQRTFLEGDVLVLKGSLNLALVPAEDWDEYMKNLEWPK